MNFEAVIGTERISDCFLCGGQGQILHTGLHDRLFGAPGSWGHLQCRKCGLICLSPRPTRSESHKVYATYYTHTNGNRRLHALRERVKRELHATVSGDQRFSAGLPWKYVGQLLASVPLVKERVALYAMLLGAPNGRKILDVGCGNGDFLALMRDAGWEVAGIEPDAAAAHFAREQRAILVVCGVLEDDGFADQTFDVIVLNHVIEHVFDPVAVLRECGRVTKPEGVVVIVTPNIASLGYRVFGELWIHLDPPRHLQLFSVATLRDCCENAGLAIRVSRTSARDATWVQTASKAIQRDGIWRRHEYLRLIELLR